MNMLSATAKGASPSGLRLAVDGGRCLIEASVDASGGADHPLVVGVRPEHLAPSDRGLCGAVEGSEILGAETIIHARLESGEKLVASLRGIYRLSLGEAVAFTVEPRLVHVFDASGIALAPMCSSADDSGHWPRIPETIRLVDRQRFDSP